MASKAYYKKQLSVVNKKNNVTKNIDAEFLQDFLK